MYAIARAAMDRQAIKTWLDAAWAVVGEGDRYFAAEKPFDKALSEERKGTILYVTAEVVRQIAILAQPAMPASCAKLLDLLAQTGGRAHVRGAGRRRPAAAGHGAAGAAGRVPALRRSGCAAATGADAAAAQALAKQAEGRQEGCRARRAARQGQGREAGGRR